MEKIMENNVADLVGKVIEGPLFNHKTHGEAYYMIRLGLARKSGYEDKIRVIVCENALYCHSPVVGEILEVNGSVRTYNRTANEKNTLEVTVFAKTLNYVRKRTFEYKNEVCFEGFICKRPVRRTSPLGREICDLMVAVNRPYNKSDYIPTVAWGRTATFCERLTVGDKVCVSGRIQSREYRKYDDDGMLLIKTAYEVSVTKIEVVEG